MEKVRQITKAVLVVFFTLSQLFALRPWGGDFQPSKAVTPSDETKYLQIEANDKGFDTFRPRDERGGYRYGPSMILNKDGSLDVWSAANGPGDLVDLVSYNRLICGGRLSTGETIAVKPTPESLDQNWTCDPGVIKFGGYYYVGYTTTADTRGVDNDVCVARSKKPDGPYEKWTGSGWGICPAPLVEYTGNPEYFGCGEPSFVLMGDMLYIYYTWADETGAATRVATADATDENWPATIRFCGECIPPKNGGDSADVKYVDAYGRFVAVFTEKRFSDDSYVAVWESFDGLSFRQSGFVKANTAKKLHNCGISGRADGHIGKNDPVYLAYAYEGAGGTWGNWSTRMHRVTLSLADAPKTDDTAEQNTDLVVVRKPLNIVPQVTTIKADKQVYTLSKPQLLWAMALDADGDYFPLLTDVWFSGYDRSVIRIVGNLVVPVAPGTTRLTLHWHGFSGDCVIHVTDDAQG